LCVVWGTSWIAGSTIAGQIPPFYAAAARSLLGVIFLIPVILVRRTQWPRGRALRAILILSITMIVFPVVVLVWAEGHLSSAAPTILFAAAPLLAAGLLPGVEGRHAPSRVMTAMLLGIAAIAAATDGYISLAHAGAAAAVFLAVLSTAASAVYARHELKQTSPLASTALLFAGATLFFALISLGTERGRAAAWNAYTIGSLLFLGVLAGAAGFSLYLWLLQEMEAYQAITVQWCAPLVGIFEAALLSHEPLSGARFLGTAVALGCLIVVMRTRFSGDDVLKLEVTQ
jgi:drug/metabolite transporter (DMT)-like permease